MSTTNINKINKEYWWKQATFNSAYSAGTLEVGAIYHITDVEYQLAILTGSSAPTTSTQGSVGQQYLDTTNNKLYICAAASTTYTWLELAMQSAITNIVNGTTVVGKATLAAGYTEDGEIYEGLVSLQGNIDNEATTRASADTTLQTNIDAKASVTFVRWS